jgi:hypothetical protein
MFSSPSPAAHSPTERAELQPADIVRRLMRRVNSIKKPQRDMDNAARGHVGPRCHNEVLVVSHLTDGIASPPERNRRATNIHLSERLRLQ